MLPHYNPKPDAVLEGGRCWLRCIAQKGSC